MMGVTSGEKSPFEGGLDCERTAMETAVVTGIARLVAARAESRFCMASGMYCPRWPGMTSFPGDMYLMLRDEEKGKMLVSTHLLATFGSAARACRSSFRVPIITEMPEFRRAVRTCWLGSNRRICVTPMDFRRETTLAGAGRLSPFSP